MLTPPVPINEMDRLLALSAFDFDYSNFKDSFKDLTKLAAKIAGTEISLVNLIDSLTQWTVTEHGLEVDQTPREDTVCQYTIMQPDHLEVNDLAADARFKDQSYVTGELQLRYYFGVPLNVEGSNIGALCVLDKNIKDLEPEKKELLKIIADEIVSRLQVLKEVDSLKHKLGDAHQTQRKVAHDIRGPLGGIIGLAQIISEQGHNNQMDEVLEFTNLIQKSGHSILELADEILNDQQLNPLLSDEYNLLIFKDKLKKLYSPQAKNKDIEFTVNAVSKFDRMPFAKSKLLQIAGNLISNAIKFTPDKGKVSVDLDIKAETDKNVLLINVKDTGVGLTRDLINDILSGSAPSTNGTGGERGYGFGLALVKHLVDDLDGTMQIDSIPDKGSSFKISLPQSL